ncbi:MULTISPECIES: CopG family transcriptional regulator [unclassified Rathayibacter]|uniref:CopG family transcriptional regulator n=1 Tax=unclassified Rathayibacter TaxID=2609250 RepID=UPI00215709EE|nr:MULTISPECIES: CopG family transcriptional regulator [unclassified Rathayibacter]
MPNAETTPGTTSGQDATTTEQLVRLSINMNPETAAALKEFAQAKRLSYTEAVRRAIAIAKYIEDEVREGRKIQTVDADRNEVRELILM